MGIKTWWIAAALAVAALPAGVSAQTAVGLRVGQRASQLDTDQEGSSSTSLVVGGYFAFALTHRLALQFEVIYGSRGGEGIGFGDNALDAAAPPAALDMEYIEIPVLLRAGIPVGRFLPSIFVGPYVGILLDCQLTPDGQDGRKCDEADVTPRFSDRNTDFGVTFGASLDFVLGENTVFVDSRYSLGLLSIQSGEDPFDARHSGFELSAGFAVPLGR